MWQRAVQAAMNRALRTGTEHISDMHRRQARTARLKADYERLLSEEKGKGS